eukprot:TRINITY_DN5070_c0_g3_i1.p1 TRINITY_DN5070_c0_g3~~TRINITY_DN5070_c0_g3_i1.p1  ORF type:complete len:205 (+),score=57.66 TRINITY_DN5070_c0_g3_i1:45-659(+)
MEDAQVKQLKEGIEAILSRWTVLCLAVQNQWGGPETKTKYKEMKSTILDWMNGADLFQDEVEDLLDDFLVNDFCTEAQDGSIGLVAKGLIKMYNECREGKTEFLEYVKSMRAPAGAAQSIGMKSENYESDDYEDMSEEEEGAAEGEGNGMNQGADAPTTSEAAASSSGSTADVPAQQPEPEAPSKPQPDPDGWTTVATKGKKKR